MKHLSNYEDVLRRHAIPEVLFAPDITLVLGIPEPEAEDRMRSGSLGPRFYVGGRAAILRQDFLAALADLSDAGDEAARELLAPRLRAVRPEDHDGR